MMRLLCSFLLALASFIAFAQSSGAEPPVEHASMLTVVVFIVFFIVACVAYVAYAWWSGKKEKERGGR
jgi:membrane protein DedA with SNARE-associated domain